MMKPPHFVGYHCELGSEEAGSKVWKIVSTDGIDRNATTPQPALIAIRQPFQPNEAPKDADRRYIKTKEDTGMLGNLPVRIVGQ